LPADGGAFLFRLFPCRRFRNIALFFRRGRRAGIDLAMRFRIRHLTRYRYAGTASESFMEARLTPVNDERQKLLARRLATSPSCSIHSYTDYFGNAVETFSVVQRHRELTLESHTEVETCFLEPPATALDFTVSDSRHLNHDGRLRLFEFLRPSPAIPLSAPVQALARQFFRPRHGLGESLLRFLAWIHENFRYAPGTTAIETPISAVLKTREGVCQDFAQIMIAVLRSAEIPARYVTGYIETESQRQAAENGGPNARRAPRLIGASESHAWAEVYLPGGFWFPLDPTNNCVAGERHVKIGNGRDYHDCTPTRGVFKGTRTEKLDVAVAMQRI
jgi:transglutaminase-like putative cysteine protease